MIKTIIFLLMFCATSLAQHKFEVKDASGTYDAQIEVERVENGFGSGKLNVTLFKKNSQKAFQEFKLDYTEFLIEEAQLKNVKMMYDYQSVVFLEDYNFDGAEDLAIRDGNNGGYGGPSYQVYLFSKQAGKFIHNPSLTNLAQDGFLGMFEVDKKRRVLRARSKSGCCWHQTQEFSVAGNRAKKIFEETEDATIADENRVKITTKRLVSGRWRTKVRYVKREG